MKHGKTDLVSWRLDVDTFDHPIFEWREHESSIWDWDDLLAHVGALIVELGHECQTGPDADRDADGWREVELEILV